VTLPGREVRRRAWELILDGAQAYVVDVVNAVAVGDANSCYEFTPGEDIAENWDRVTDEALIIIRELRALYLGGKVTSW